MAFSLQNKAGLSFAQSTVGRVEANLFSQQTSAEQCQSASIDTTLHSSQTQPQAVLVPYTPDRDGLCLLE